MDEPFISYKIDDRSYVAFLKREIHNLLLAAGFGVHRAGEVDIVVSELTSNLIKYADGGEVLYRITESKPEGKRLELYCLDNGKGISNVSRIMEDGYSTSNTLGQGLGAVKRLSEKFLIHSARDWGTVQFIKALPEKTEPLTIPGNSRHLRYATLQTCAPGEKMCGDGFHVKESATGFQVFVGDGLGHGPHAHEAVSQAIAAFRISREKDPAALIRELHESVRKTRGLVATVAIADIVNNTWSLCGVGNIHTKIFTGLDSKVYTPYNGIIGNNVPRTLNPTTIPFDRNQILAMHSDGLRTRWPLGTLPLMLKKEPELIAAALYKDNIRGNDDATVLVAKMN